MVSSCKHDPVIVDMEFRIRGNDVAAMHPKALPVGSKRLPPASRNMGLQYCIADGFNGGTSRLACSRSRLALGRASKNSGASPIEVPAYRAGPVIRRFGPGPVSRPYASGFCPRVCSDPAPLAARS